MKNDSVKNKFLWGITAAGIIFLASFAFYLKQPRELKILDEPAVTKVKIYDGDEILGNKKAGITIAEFGDFECSACKSAQPVIKKILEQFGDSAQIVWKDMPISGTPSMSARAHIAAHCAGAEGAFEEYADILFARQEEWKSNQNFLELAKLVQKIDAAKFENCMKTDKKIPELIQKNIGLGVALGVDALPYFIINDQYRFSGVPNFDLIKNALNRIK